MKHFIILRAIDDCDVSVAIEEIHATCLRNYNNNYYGNITFSFNR